VSRPAFRDSPIPGRVFPVAARRACLLAGLLAVAAGADAAVDCEGLPAAPPPTPEPAFCAGATPAALIAAAADAIESADLDGADRRLDCAQARLARHDDPAIRQALVRTRGNVLYRRERIVDALRHYDCALHLAEQAGDPIAVATVLNNIGTAWTRLGDAHDALQALDRSLAMQTASSGRLHAMTMMNLADLRRRLGDADGALRDYRAAIEGFRREGAYADSGHALLGMARLALNMHDYPLAEARLRATLAEFRRVRGRPLFLLRTYAGLIEVALAQGDPAAARRRADEAQAFATTQHVPVLPAPLQVQIAEVERREGRSADARHRLEQALAGLADRDPERIPVLDALAALQQAAGDLSGALARQAEARAQEQARNRRERDQALDALRFRVDRDRRVAALTEERRAERARFRWAMSAVALLLLVLAAWFLRRRWRNRLREIERQARHEAEIARYRRMADELRVDRGVLQATLDSHRDALCVLDGSGRLLAINAGARAWLGDASRCRVGEPLADALPDAVRPAWNAALDRLDEDAGTEFALAGAGLPVPLVATLVDRTGEEGVLLLRLRPAEAGPTPASPAVQAGTPAVDLGDAMNDGFRRALVELMLSAVAAWERSTGLHRLELAERSRIWRVAIDDGRLRARTMERYLSLAKLPRKPHDRAVLRTAYFVLAHPDVDAATRGELQARVDAVMGCARRSALE
jgi:tetratricopeptide (TPR) repeat protein